MELGRMQISVLQQWWQMADLACLAFSPSPSPPSPLVPKALTSHCNGPPPLRRTTTTSSSSTAWTGESSKNLPGCRAPAAHRSHRPIASAIPAHPGGSTTTAWYRPASTGPPPNFDVISVEFKGKGNEWILQPNPAQDYLELVNTSTSGQAARACLYSLTGREIKCQQLESGLKTRMGLPAGLPKGVYLLRLESGRDVVTKRVLVQ